MKVCLMIRLVPISIYDFTCGIWTKDRFILLVVLLLPGNVFIVLVLHFC